MRGHTFLIAFAAGLLAISAGRAWAQDDRTISGRVTSITVDDPTYTRGLSKDEQRYAVRVTFTNVPDSLVLGFGEGGKPVSPYLSMLDLLTTAMERGWNVQLRLNREVAGGNNSRSYARIVSVTVSP